MNAANLPPASVLRPELRARLERLEHLERRERQNRYARWHVPAPAEREPEGWLLTYLDLITLLLVMLVVMLAFSAQPKVSDNEAIAVAAASKPATGPAHPDTGSPQAHGAADQTLTTSPLTSADSGSGSSSASSVPSRATAAGTSEASEARPGSETDIQANPPEQPVLPEGLAASAESSSSVTAQDMNLNPAAELAPAALPAIQTLERVQQPASGYDRPAPVDVALVGSVRSSQSLQTALPFPYDLSHVSASATPVSAENAISDGTAQAPSADATQDAAQPQRDVRPAAAADGPDSSSRAIEKAAIPPPSLEDLGLNGLGENIDVIINEESVSFRINNEILFTSGQADLMPSGLEVLTRLAGVLARNDYQIAVEGHTDPVPIQNDRFPSNWELSTGRATSVLRHLQSQGIPASRLRATGYADTRPIAPNDSPAGRAFNRRVELIMEMPPGAPKAAQSSSSASAGDGMSLPGSEFSGPIVRLR